MAIRAACPAAQADDAPNTPVSSSTPLQAAYRYSAYREGSLPADKISNTSGERYRVDSYQFRLSDTLAGTNDLAADLVVETMGGASPWFITPGANGKPIQVLSGASIEDRRQALTLSDTRRFGNGSAGVDVNYSHERDYRSAGIGLSGSYDLDHQLDTLSAGLSFTENEIKPTDGDSVRFPDRIVKAHSHEFSAYAGITRVVNVNTQIETSLTYTQQTGYLSDPYKLAYVGGNLLPDQRPDGRREFAWLTRLRYFVPAADAALHLDYRYYADDWELRAHTVDIAWYQQLPHDWLVVPRVRWYSQSKADFYAPYYLAQPSNYLVSSDYRLSPYGALSLGAEASKKFHSWTFSARYENYRSGARYSLHSVDVQNPGLVDFQVFSIALKKEF
jgi:hypothetical protein